MPTTRRSASGGGRSSPTANSKQATLSFNHRVTKSVPKSAKDSVKVSSSASTPAKQSPLAIHVTYPESEPEPAVKTDDVEVDTEPEPDVDEKKDVKVELEPKREKPEAEVRAEKITTRQISQYWHKLEAERRTKRVHQQQLTVAEKILRYWDVSSQYGPCVGITRMRRWQRAERLGLNPPIEVLAVLIQEERKGAKGIERAHMDDILNSTAIGSG